MTSTSCSSAWSRRRRSTARRWSLPSRRRRRTGSPAGAVRPSTCTSTTSARTSSGGCPPGRTSRTRPARPRIAAAAATLPAGLPRHGLDAAPGGRAPTTVGTARLLHPQRDAQARGARGRGRRGQPARLHRRRPATVAGPFTRGRLVGARRRVEAVARRRRYRADGRGPTAPYGPPVLIGPTIGLAAVGGPGEVANGNGGGRRRRTNLPLEPLPKRRCRRPRRTTSPA